MKGVDMASSDAESAKAIVAEAGKTKETADRLANGDYPEDADHIRVLAGMVRQLAEQVEGLGALWMPKADAPDASQPQDFVTDPSNEAEGGAEEDLTPEKSPAEPLDDRSRE
jgi:hypothetical protein